VSSDEPTVPRTSGPARPAALLVVRITAADVGRRVSLRHRYDDATLTDVVGLLLAWESRASGDVLLVQRRDGTLVTVAFADVVAAKVVPEQPARPARPAPPGGDTPGG
jgi:hypothetical protein